MTVQDLCNYLASAGLGLVVDQNLFAFAIPETPASLPAVGVVPYLAGRVSEQAFGSDRLRWEFPRLQINVRGKEYDNGSAFALAYDCYLQIGRINGRLLGSTFYHRVQVQHPFFLRYAEKREPLYAFNCEAAKDV